VKAPALSPRDRRAALLGAAVLAPALAWTLAVSPYLGALADARDRLDAERALLAKERALVAAGAEYPRAFEAGAARLLKAAPRLMGGDDDGAASAAVAGYVRRVAKLASAHVERVEPAATRAAGTGVTALPVAVHGEGDLEGVLTLLHLLETGPKLVHLDDLRLEAEERRTHAGASYAVTPFFTATAAEAPEVIRFRLTVTGFTLAPAGPAAARKEEAR
jgi:hypothetical protein